MESQKNLEAKPKVAIIGGGAWGLVFLFEHLPYGLG